MLKIFFVILLFELGFSVLFPKFLNEEEIERIEKNFEDFEKKNGKNKKPEVLQPIVIIPGLSCSQLEAKLTHVHEEKWWCFHNTKDFELLFVNIVDLIPYLTGECMAFNLDVFFNSTTKEFSNHKGIEIRGRHFGDTDGVEYLSPIMKKKSAIYYYFVEWFVKQGYTRGKNIRGAPYDFRMAPQTLAKNGVFDSIVKLIEETYKINNNTKVHLMGHSMGGPMAAYFLSLQSQEWKNKFIDSFFSFAGSFDGGYEMIAAYHSGKVPTLPVEMRGLVTKSGGGSFMLPRKDNKENIVIYSKKRNYTLGQVDEFLRDANLPITKQVKDYVDEVDMTKLVPGVKTHCFRAPAKSDWFKTPVAFQMDDVSTFGDYKVVGNIMGGDTTVAPFSAALCDDFANRQKEPVIVSEFNGEKYKDTDYHRYITYDPDVFQVMWDFMYKNK